MRRGILGLVVVLASLLLSGSAEAQPCNGCGIGYWYAGVPATGGPFTGAILLPDGSNAAPSIARSSQTNTGIYFGNTYIAWSIAGASYGALLTTGITSYGNSIFMGGASDVVLTRDAANTLARKNGNADQFNRLYGANGGYWEQGVNSELLTIAAAATTDTTGNLLPANAIIEAVVVRVTTIIPTAANFTVGDATTAARFATGVLVAADTTAVGLLHRNPDVAAAAGPVQTTAAKVRITPNSSPAAATGVVRIEVFFSRFVPPTS